MSGTDPNGYPEPLEAIPAYLVNDRERKKRARIATLIYVGLLLTIIGLVTNDLVASARNTELLERAQQERICILELQVQERRVLFALGVALNEANARLAKAGIDPVESGIAERESAILNQAEVPNLADPTPSQRATEQQSCVRK